MLECGNGAGAGLLWTVSGGVPRSSLIVNRAAARTNQSGLNFIQISHSHIGFNKAPNPDAMATFKALLDCISATNPRPTFMNHTGDVSHFSRDTEWDTAQQLGKETGIETHFIPSEHDMLIDGGKPFLFCPLRATSSAGRLVQFR